jgi:hypothetical protein
MAKNPLITYPGKVLPSSPQYPYGEPRNVTVNGDGTGTPFEAEYLKDIYGWQQAILVEANIVPSNTADTATASQYLEGIKKLARIVNLTTSDIITTSTDYTDGTVLQTTGYHSSGDGGEGMWRKTGNTGAPSQDPAALGEAKFTDLSGDEWELVNTTLINVASLGVNTGIDSAPIFNAALTSVVDGGTVFNKSTYDVESGEITIPPSKTLIVDLGKIRLRDGSDTPLISGTNIFTVVITGNFIDGNKANQTTPPAAIGDYPLINISGSERVTVKDCYIKNAADVSIEVNDTKQVRVIDNNINNSQSHGIVAAGNNELVLISSNTVKGITEGAGIIPMGNAVYTSVVNNIVEDVDGDSGDAITCYSDTGKFITIAGNVVKDVEGHGIHTGGEYVTVTGNAIDSVTAAGIYIRSQSTTANYVSVTGNTVNADTIGVSTFARDGIYINNVETFAVTGNTIHNAQDHGIHLKQCAGGVVNGNSVTTSLNTGLYSEIDGIRNVYCNNVFRNINSTAMLFDQEDQGKINDNLIESWSVVDASGYGIDLTGTLMSVENNSIRRGTGTVPAIGNSVSATVTLSKFKDNVISSGSTINKGSVASNTTTNLPHEYDYITISGTTQIDNMNTDTYEGREVTLRCTSSGLTIKDGVGNLILNGDFVTSGSSSFIRLLFSGGSWFELTRSIN